MDQSNRGENTVADDRGLGVTFGTTDERQGVLVTDPIERHQFELYTSQPPSLDSESGATFHFPVDAAVSVTTDRIELPAVYAVYVRDDDGTMLAEAEHFAYEEFPEGTYGIEICAPMKLYLRVTSPVTVSADATTTEIQFDGPRRVAIGARSHHKQPAATVTTTDDPVDIMTGISLFGSALKTTSPERSYPTLRGHPPLLERGAELDVPDGLEPADTGVRLELPPEYGYIYVAAPLAYYLGAEVVPGEVPRLVTDEGFEHRLDGIRGFEREVERVLKQTFFFDCITRTEGYYQVDLHERRAVEDAVDIDFAARYDESLAAQLETYLQVPYETIESYVPEWKLTSHVAPTADNLELLPFVTNDLAVVRTPESRALPESEVQATAANEFFRDGDDSGFTRSAATPTDANRSYVQPEATDSLEQAWMGEGTPVGASKATHQAYQNRLTRSPAEGDIGITVVCNDSRMVDERDVVDEVYASRDALPFDVSVEYGLTVDELRRTLTAQTDFLHYIGHIDGAGFRCTDGRLDVATLDTVGTDAFLLNACQSYEQGSALVDAGAIGGIVTLSDVVNDGAVRIGVTLARLLNRGFPLRSALDVARDDSVIASQYIVVGDGGLAIAQAENGIPNLCEIRTVDDGFELDYKAFPTSESGMGSIIFPHIHENSQHFLSSGTIETFEMSRDELEHFLALEETPVVYENELRWSSEVDVESL